MCSQAPFLSPVLDTNAFWGSNILLKVCLLLVRVISCA